MADSFTQLYLVRHAESTFGAAGRTAGRSDPDLSPLGVRQAAAVGEYLANVRLAAVYSSPLLRARRTAEAVGRRQDLPVRVDTGLRELDQGELEGLPLTTLAERYAELLARWREDPGVVRLPGGETLAEVQARAWAAV